MHCKNSQSFGSSGSPNSPTQSGPARYKSAGLPRNHHNSYTSESERFAMPRILYKSIFAPHPCTLLMSAGHQLDYRHTSERNKMGIFQPPYTIDVTDPILHGLLASGILEYTIVVVAVGFAGMGTRPVPLDLSDRWNLLGVNWKLIAA